MPIVASSPISAPPIHRPAAQHEFTGSHIARARRDVLSGDAEPRLTTFPSTRASSIGTTASAPSGNSPPVGILTAVVRRERAGENGTHPDFTRKGQRRRQTRCRDGETIHRRTRCVRVIVIGRDIFGQHAPEGIVERTSLDDEFWRSRAREIVRDGRLRREQKGGVEAAAG